MSKNINKNSCQNRTMNVLLILFACAVALWLVLVSAATIILPGLFVFLFICFHFISHRSRFALSNQTIHFSNTINKHCCQIGGHKFQTTTQKQTIRQTKCYYTRRAQKNRKRKQTLLKHHTN